MNEYGVEDLLKHIIYVNKKREIKPIKVYSINRVTFLVLGYCYQYGVDINYDLIFEKTSSGARSRFLDERKYVQYREVDLEKGEPITELINNSEVNDMIGEIIELSNSSYHEIVEFLTSSNEYKKDHEAIKDAKEDNSLFSSYPYWTKSEITSLFQAHSSIDRRNSIPAGKNEYEVIKKYLSLDDEWGKTAPFTKCEILILNGIPSHRLLLFDEFGVHYNETYD